MAKVELYKKKNSFCPFCDAAERLLRAQGFNDITFIYIDEDDSAKQEMMVRSQQRTVPQVFINGEHIGGFDKLSDWAKTGELQRRFGQ